MNWNFEIIQDWDTIWSESHQERWLQHMDAAENAHVFFHPALVKAWVETYMPLRKLSPLFVWATWGESIVTLPLVLPDAMAVVTVRDGICELKCVEGNLNDWSIVCKPIL